MDFFSPPKLKEWSHIRIIAPARSCALLSEENIINAQRRLESHWFTISYGEHIFEKDMFFSSSKKSRIHDLHEAFRDISVNWILTVIWWYNSNDLLDDINYDLIRNNPKVLCWFSDITALSTAITKKTWLITYSWPHFSSRAMKKWFEYSERCFLEIACKSQTCKLVSSEERSDDAWYLDQDNRDIIKNSWYVVVNEWHASWKLWWWNLCTLNLLQWTEYMPDLANAILFLEDTDMPWDHFPMEFKRNIISLLSQINWSIKWLLVWRFPKKTNMNNEKFKYIIEDIEWLKNIPIVTNVDFWHTTPINTIPIWWYIEMFCAWWEATITITW